MSASSYPPAAPRPSGPGSGYDDGRRPGGGGSGGSRLRMMLAVGTVAVIGLAVLVVAVLFSGKNDGSDTTPTGSGGSATGAQGPHSIAAPVEGRTKAVLEVTTGAEGITIRAADLGSDLYRAVTPGDGSLVPQATVNGDTVQLALSSTGKTGAATAEIQLNASVIWQLKLAGGGMKETVDFSAGKLSGVELLAGAGEIDVTLPKPAGAVEVKLAGGAGQLRVHAPTGVPVQVKLGTAGAGVLTIDGRTQNSVKAATTITPDGWAKAADRYSIETVVGVSTLVVDRV